MKTDSAEPHDDLRDEYDAAVFQHGVRGKYAKQYAEGNNLVLLDPDVAAAFPEGL